jgi:hypothetical protein
MYAPALHHEVIFQYEGGEMIMQMGTNGVSQPGTAIASLAKRGTKTVSYISRRVLPAFHYITKTKAAANGMRM